MCTCLTLSRLIVGFVEHFVRRLVEKIIVICDDVCGKQVWGMVWGIAGQFEAASFVSLALCVGKM